MTKATFAAGCFWHVEDLFRKLPGVTATRVGYIGGRTSDPTYKEVCTDTTGHAEAIEIDFDPKNISYNELLKFFWENHNPTTLNQQGPDSGSQYRSAVFYHSPEQKEQALEMKANFERMEKFNKPIVTEIVAATTFHEAEEYHQKYLEKNGLAACPTNTQKK